MILVLDFGSQYTQLIARRVREAKVYCEIHPFNFPLEKIEALKPEGIILSGGPASVYQENAPKVKAGLFKLPVPFLGICYGMGMINLASGGEVARAERREYGPAELMIDNDADLFHGFAKKDLVRVWMSHGDKMTSMPKGWQVLAHSGNSPIAAFADPLQHPALCFFKGAPSQRANSKGAQEFKNVIEPKKEIAPGPKGLTAGQPQIALLGAERIEFVQLLFARQNSSRFEMVNNRQRYEHRAAPRRHFTNVKRRPAREQHHFHRDRRQIFPRKLTQQRKVKLAERVHLRNAAATNDIRARLLHKWRVHRTARELQCKICFR